MPEFDHGIKMIAETTGRQLAQVAGVTCTRWRPLESTLQATTERLADRVFQGNKGREKFVVYFEFFTHWHKDACWSMLGKSGLLSEREQLPTISIAVILLPRGYKPQQGQIRLEAAGGPTQQLWFREVCLWTRKPEPWWEGEPGLMALYPLCQHGEQPRRAVQHASEVIERTVVGDIERADGLALLSIFSGLAYPRLDVNGIIGRTMMKESRLFREAREEGQVEARRADIVDLLRARFGETRVAQQEAIVNTFEDLGLLRRLVVLAGTCSDPDEFRAGLAAEQTASR
jgi:hypothetical protein